ncbi:ferredoxin family protein [Roseiconus lacunae]|uniref:4Fe-4S dicluster domain-containing protein n=1 Tax=Roseiconus lacunae TaxID=2605694 RepID=UPI003089CC44|nr:ferredoxin family protein [Stieleria sp. HD01]
MRSNQVMPYVVTESCIGLACRECVAACPEDCFYFVPGAAHLPGVGFLLAGTDQGGMRTGMLMIHPDQCIDCGACETECPVEAIFEDTSVPEASEEFIGINARITQGMSSVEQNARRCRKE